MAVPQALVVIDDLVVRENHQKRSELDASIGIARHKHFFTEDVHACSSAANLCNRHSIEA
jgi:hypothetical protein